MWILRLKCLFLHHHSVIFASCTHSLFNYFQKFNARNISLSNWKPSCQFAYHTFFTCRKKAEINRGLTILSCCGLVLCNQPTLSNVFIFSTLRKASFFFNFMPDTSFGTIYFWNSQMTQLIVSTTEQGNMKIFIRNQNYLWAYFFSRKIVCRDVMNGFFLEKLKNQIIWA